MNKRWLLAGIPAALGFAAGLVLNLTPINNPVLYLRADLGTLVFLTSLLVSVMAALTMLVAHRLKTLQEEMTTEAVQDRRRFIRLLDHELKNPLTAIMAGLANLANGNAAPEQKNALRSVENQVQRLIRLVTDLRKLSDLETRSLELTTVDLTDLLQEVFDFAQSQGQNQRAFNILLPKAPWPLPQITADRDLLMLALLNLLDNAIKFSEPGDTIELRASEDGNDIEIEIADTGPGIPQEEMPHIWQELYRGEGARGIPGSGLGLALVQAIIHRHNGEVAMRSRTGQGTVVTVRLHVSEVTKS